MARPKFRFQMYKRLQQSIPQIYADAKKAAPAPFKAEGKVRTGVIMDATSDADLNGGGPTVFFYVGRQQYRLCFCNLVHPEHRRKLRSRESKRFQDRLELS